MQKQNTVFRLAVPSAKRFASLIYWLAHSLSFNSLASLFSIGKSTAVEIVHTGVSVLRKHMVPKSIVFPTGDELRQVVVKRHLSLEFQTNKASFNTLQE